MSPRLFFAILPFCLSGAAMGQDAPAPAAAGDAATQSEKTAEARTPAPAAASAAKDWRDVSGYPFPALADTVAAAQNMAQAMILRDYCANAKLPDAFVRERLARFSRITGREENCRSLLDY